jgi:hypothetical protein
MVRIIGGGWLGRKNPTPSANREKKLGCQESHIIYDLCKKKTSVIIKESELLFFFCFVLFLECFLFKNIKLIFLKLF